MLNLRLCLFFFVALTGVNSVAAACWANKGSATQGGGQNKVGKVTLRPTVGSEEVEGAQMSEMKVLAEGAYAKVEAPLLVVAREEKVYKALRGLAESLPELGADYFKKNAVVAAFAGTRRTGGYGVEIMREADGSLRVSEASPPKDAMVAQALTAPFRVVSVPVSEGQPLGLHFAGAWEGSLRPYRVNGGDFRWGGGFAGRTEDLRLKGSLRVMRYKKLATFVFNLEGVGGKQERNLHGLATGLINDNALEIPSMDAGTLVDQPRRPLRATGSLSEKERRLTLFFESLPSMVSDGYGGSGKLEASAAEPPTSKTPQLTEP